jgi:hypothetical protein
MLTWSWIIQITIISFTLIFLMHHLINFFKSVLTVPKIKDLVNTPKQKYNDIYNVISSKQIVNDINYNLEDILPNNNNNNNNNIEKSMKTELKNFIKKQLNNNNSNNSNLEGTSSIQSLDSINDTKFSFID